MDKISVNPLVSVIVPNYNHARFLDERMESILGQTYQNFEVIILDDVSTDNSREVIEKYRNDPRVSQIVYNDENSGSPFKQWNKGFRLAEGELVWIAESDDSCERMMLERLVHCFEEYPDLSYAFAHSVSVDENGRERFELQRNIRNDLFLDGRTFNHRYLLWGNIVFNASSVLFRKDAAMTVDPEYMNYRGAGDWLFWMEMAEKGSVAYVAQKLNHYRMYGQNTTAKASMSGREDIEDHQVLQKFKSHGYGTPLEWLRIKKKYVCLIRYFNRYEDEAVRQHSLSLWTPGPLVRLLAWGSYQLQK